MAGTLTLESIAKIQSDVSDYAFKSKISEEETVNKFLDGIISFKKRLNDSTHSLNKLVVGFEKLTWFESGSDEETLKSLNDLLTSAKGYISNLKRNYAHYNKTFRVKGIAKEELGIFKHAIFDLEEVVEDVEMVYFEFPKSEQFTIANNRLKAI